MVKLIDSIDGSNIKHFISKLDKNIFKTLREPKGVECNLLLVEVKNNYGTFRFIKRADGVLVEPKIEVLKQLSSSLFTSANKLCLFKVNKGYIKEQNQESNISLVLFSETINKRTKEVKYIICGLLFLKEKMYKKSNNLYIPLICCKPGIGSGFMLLAEKIAQDLGYDKLTLNSMADPLGFYIHKGYQFDKGNDVYTLENPLFLDKYNKKTGEVRTVYQNAANHAGYLNQKGRLVSHRYRKIGTQFGIPRQKVKDVLSRSQKKLLGRSVSALMRVKMKGNEIGMYKKFKKTNSNPIYRIGTKVMGRPAGKKTRKNKK